MTPPNGIARLAGRLLGSSKPGLMGAVIPFLTGAMVASTVISLLRHEQPRIAAALRKPSASDEGSEKTLEELIAEKEHLEDLIAEAAAKQSRK